MEMIHRLAAIRPRIYHGFIAAFGNPLFARQPLYDQKQPAE